MAKKIVIRRMGQTMKEGTVVRWLKNDGDMVKSGDKLYELEYDKASVEVESPADGTLHIIEQEGATLPVGTLVAKIFESGEAVPETPAGTEPSPAQVSEGAGESKAKKTESYAASASAKRLIRQNGLNASDIVPANGRRITEEDVTAFLGKTTPENGGVRVTPFAKKIADANGVLLDEVAPTGRGNKIVAADVEGYIKTTDKGGAIAGGLTAERIAMSSMRRAIAKNMTQSYFSTPVVTYFVDMDVSGFLNMRKEINEAYEQCGAKVSINDLLLKAVASTLKEYPDLNASIDDTDIIYHSEINIGMAVAVPGGLLVPVIKNADGKSPKEIAQDTQALISKALGGTISAADMEGGTFTVSNLGSKGINTFTPIINVPQAAILGVGKVQDKPVAVSGSIEIKPILSLSLTADHRLIDGAMAADFLDALKKIIEKPFLMFV